MVCAPCIVTQWLTARLVVFSKCKSATCPEDLTAWFELDIHSHFSKDPRPLSRLVKMVDKTGEVSVFACNDASAPAVWRQARW